MLMTRMLATASIRISAPSKLRRTRNIGTLTVPEHPAGIVVQARRISRCENPGLSHDQRSLSHSDGISGCPLWATRTCPTNVRFTSKSGHRGPRLTCPLCAISGHGGWADFERVPPGYTIQGGNGAPYKGPSGPGVLAGARYPWQVIKTVESAAFSIVEAPHLLELSVPLI